MSENFKPFKLDVISNFVRDCDWENCPPISVKELEQPSASLVQYLYFNFLREFGFSDSLLMIPFEVLEDLEYPDIYKDMVPIMSLQAGCVHLFDKLTGNSDFGIMDLLNPTPKRTQKFLSVMQNFWLFCNNHYPHVERIQGEVDRLVRSRVECETKIEEYKNKINHSKSKAVEEKAEEDDLMAEIDHLREELKQMFPKQKELNEVKGELKAELESLKLKTASMLEQMKNLETERDNLLGVFEGAAILQKLDQELHEIREELEIKEKRKLEFRNHLELLGRWKEDYTAVLELVQQIAQEQQKTRELVAKIREQHSVMETVKSDREELDSVIREKENQIKEKSAVLAKMRGQWARRKKGKEEEIQQGSADLEQAKLQMGEEQLAAMELSNKMRDINLMHEDEVEEMAREAANIRAHYSTLLEAMEKFNAKLNEDFKKIGDARDKLSQGPPAL